MSKSESVTTFACPVCGKACRTKQHVGACKGAHTKSVKCPKCGTQEKRYEVKIKDAIKEYFICWPCYDKSKGIA